MHQTFPTLQAFLDADSAGWTRQLPKPGCSVWRHTNGLSMQVQAQRSMTWQLEVSMGSIRMPLSLRRTGTRLSTDITPLAQDIATWIEGLDLHARIRMGNLVGTWLVRHGRQGVYQVRISDRSTNIVSVVPEIFRSSAQIFMVPHQLVDALRPDIQEMWARTRTPLEFSSGPLILEHEGARIEQRSFSIQLSQSQHTRMQVLARFPAILDSIPGPVPSVQYGSEPTP